MIRQAFPMGNTADGGLGTEKIFPYIYNFVNDDDDDNTFAGGIGINIAPGASGNLSIKLKPDYNFVPRWVRLTCYYLNVGAGNYEFWETPPASAALYPDTVHRLAGNGLPLTAYIALEMNVFPDARFMIGGRFMNQTNTLDIVLLPQINSPDSGIRGIPQPYMLPANGKIQFTFTSAHPTKTILVGGCVYGLKVRL